MPDKMNCMDAPKLQGKPACLTINIVERGSGYECFYPVLGREAD